MYFIAIKIRRILITIILIVFVLLFISSLLSYTSSSTSQPMENGIYVPIIMYHSVLKDSVKTDKYTITPSKLEEDFIFLKDQGYHCIFVSDLIRYVYNSSPLPEKPIIITFDDGYLNNLTYTLPLIEKYNMKATISIVGIYTDTNSKINDPNVNYAYLTWENIASLKSSNIIEISNHSYNMHTLSKRTASMRKTGESLEDYTLVLKKDILSLQSLLYENCKIDCIVFTYPFGLISSSSIPIIKDMGFLASLSCKEKINYITKHPDCLYLLGRFNRHGKLSTEQFMSKIMKASTKNKLSK